MKVVGVREFVIDTGAEQGVPNVFRESLDHVRVQSSVEVPHHDNRILCRVSLVYCSEIVPKLGFALVIKRGVLSL